jgi:hypothetical protein
MSLLYDYNNPWIINCKIKVLPIPASHIKNKQISISWYNYFLCITSLNIDFGYSFNCLSELWYSNFSTIIEYEDFVKFSSSKVCDFWFDALCDWITKSNYKS